MDAPSSADILWWGFNALWLVVMGMIGFIVDGVRREIRELRAEIRTERRFARWLVQVVLAMRTRCSMLHPETPMAEMPQQPEDE